MPAHVVQCSAWCVADNVMHAETTYLVFDQYGVDNGYGPIDPRVANNVTGNQPEQAQHLHMHACGCCMAMLARKLLSLAECEGCAHWRRSTCPLRDPPHTG